MIRNGYIVHLGSYIESRLCALIVRSVLERRAQSVYAVVHQCIETVFGRDRGRVDPQLRVVVISPYRFLAPVAQYIRLYARCALRIVVRKHSLRAEQRYELIVLIIPFIYLRSACFQLLAELVVKQLAEQVAVPPYAEIDRLGSMLKV